MKFSRLKYEINRIINNQVYSVNKKELLKIVISGFIVSSMFYLLMIPVVIIDILFQGQITNNSFLVAVVLQALLMIFVFGYPILVVKGEDKASLPSYVSIKNENNTLFVMDLVLEDISSALKYGLGSIFKVILPVFLSVAISIIAITYYSNTIIIPAIAFLISLLFLYCFPIMFALYSEDKHLKHIYKYETIRDSFRPEYIVAFLFLSVVFVIIMLSVALLMVPLLMVGAIYAVLLVITPAYMIIYYYLLITIRETTVEEQY